MSEAQAQPQEAPQGAAPAGNALAARYDVSSKERIVAERMPTMDIVNERFARHLQSGLFGLLRRHADVSVGTVTVHRHSAFMGALAGPSHLNLIGLRPLRGNGLVCCGSVLLHGMVEALYGGLGRQQADLPSRELSATEQRILTRFVKVVCEEYQKAWRGIHALELEYVRSETLPQFAAVAGPHEVVVSTAFELTVGELTGTLHVCMPYASLEPLRDVLYASPLGDAEAVDRRWLNMLTREIQGAEVTLAAQLATADVTIEQLLSMKPGDFIELDRDSRIEASVDGVPLFRCHYGTHNSKYAIRIDECLNPSGDQHGE